MESAYFKCNYIEHIAMLVKICTLVQRLKTWSFRHLQHV